MALINLYEQRKINGMKTANLLTRQSDNRWIYFLTSSIIIVNFLFFIDEGWYSFKWMTIPGNWIPFFIYTIVILVSQLIIQVVLDRRKNNSRSVIKSMILGIPVGVMLAIGFFSLLGTL